MGLELTTLGEIIGSEAKNNAADIFLFVRWLYEGNELLRQLPFNELYDSIDTQFGITGIDGIKYNASQAQARSQTNTENISALDSRIDDLEEADVSWSEVTEKPSTFAPSAHDHDDFYLSPTWASWIGDGTSALYNYIYCRIAGFSENDTFRSNQIREGYISRSEGLSLVVEENMPREDSIRWYFQTIGVDPDRAISAINAMGSMY